MSIQSSRESLSVVQLFLGERAEPDGKGAYRLTKSGKTITADKAYLCTGGKPNTDFLRAANSDILDSKGFVKVSLKHPRACPL